MTPHGRPHRQSDAKPPRSLERTAELLLRGERGQVVLGDLAEAYAEMRARGKSERSCRWWYVRQAAASLASFALGPRRARGASRAPGDPPMKGLLDDLWFLVRSLIRRPGFTLPVVLTLALGIGIGATVFSVVQATLLSLPGFHQPDRLVMIWNRQRHRAESSNLLSGADYQDLRERSNTLSDVAGVFEVVVAPVTGEERDEFARMGTSTPNLFDVLGVEAVLGRLFEEADGAPLPDGARVGPPGAAVLSYDYWQRELGGDEDVLGRRFFSFTGEYVVVGVLPADFQLVLPQEARMGEDLGSAIDFWTVFRTDYRQWNRSDRGTRVIARLADGYDLADVRGELDNLASWLRAEHPIHEESGLVSMPPETQSVPSTRFTLQFATDSSAGLVVKTGKPVTRPFEGS